MFATNACPNCLFPNPERLTARRLPNAGSRTWRWVVCEGCEDEDQPRTRGQCVTIVAGGE